MEKDDERQRLIDIICTTADARSSFLAVTGCGGGGGSSSGSPSTSNNNSSSTPAKVPSGTNIPEVNGLTGDADNQGLLFYTMTDPSISTSDPDRYELVAVNTQVSPVTTSIISTHLQRLNEYRGVALSFPKADIDTGTHTISNYHMDRVLFQKKIGGTQFQKKVVTTDASSFPPTPSNASSDLHLGTTLSQYDLQHPAESIVASGTGSSGKFRQFPVKASSSPALNVEDSTAEKLTPKVPLVDGSTHKPLGWLAFSADYTNDIYHLLQYDIDGTKVGEVKDGSGHVVVATSINGISVQPFPGGVFADGSQLIILEEKDNATPPAYHKVVYKFTPGTSSNPGSLTKLLNDTGDALQLPSSCSIEWLLPRMRFIWPSTPVAIVRATVSIA